MYFSEEALKSLAKEYSAMPNKLDILMKKFILLDTTNPRTREFASQGFARRVKIMVLCITNVFSAVPPERSDVPSRDELSNATINVQSFVFNVFGAIDNLAWIWMMEHGQRRRDGTPISKTHRRPRSWQYQFARNAFARISDLPVQLGRVVQTHCNVTPRTCSSHTALYPPIRN
jgi:hypothetical protein